MAKRKGKGKSRRRIKDWQQRYLADSEAPDVGAKRQKLRGKAVKLPPSRLEAPEENLEDLPKVEGMVAGFFPGGMWVRVDDEAMMCGVAGTYRPPAGASPLAVGDEVTVALARPEHSDGKAGIDRDRADGMILARAPRRTLLSRPQPRSAKRRETYGEEPFEKVIAANMDVLLIVASVRQPPLRRGLLDRFLIIAERGGLQPVLVINKIDLAGLPRKLVEDFRQIGVPVLPCSAETGEGIDRLRQELTGRRSILAGPSGVGKTSLTNRLVPGANAATRPVRRKDQKGRHTTSSTVIYDLPDGGILVDTPGLRELSIRMDAAELPWYFPEFEPYAADCKYNDCTHTHEPGCGVQAAVERGDIPAHRFQSYLRILDTIEENW